MDWLSPIRELFEFAASLLERLSVIRAILGFIIMFFLPGFAWTLVFFKKLSIMERVVLSFGLSIAVITLSLLFLNKVVGIRITGFNSVLAIVLVTIIPLAIYYLNRLIRRR